MMITILGLGPGDPGCITRAVWERLTAASTLYLRTAIHPTVAHLPAHLQFHSYDYLYEQADEFGAIYQQIAADLIARAQAGDDLLYAVPGDPFTAEATTRHILALGRSRGLTVHVLPGVSFIEPTCAALGLDPLAHGLQLIDALDLLPSVAAEGESWASLNDLDYEPPPPICPFLPTRPTLICQIYNRRVASDVKLTLLERFPADHPITVIRAAGVVGEERIWQVALYELDHTHDLDHLTSAFVPALDLLADLRGPESLNHVVTRLLGPNGCPWDREQTPSSMRSALLGEVHEVLEALDADDPQELAEELGDLLMNILLLAEMFRQTGDFSLAEVYEAVTAKLIRRHPHVFGDLQVADSADVLRNWEAIKQTEFVTKGKAARGALDGIPPSLPSLATAQELARKAAKVGFVWPSAQAAWQKVSEEISEIEAVLQDATLEPQERQAALEWEYGDLLLAIGVAARAHSIDAESALRVANTRFRQRFQAIERYAAEQGQQLSDLTLDTLLALWARAKQEES
jgi:tetrapyrrole methylase family protein/MazG family protein